MALWDLINIYGSICDFNKNRESRQKYASFRSKYLKPSLVKVAFDTRRINQDTEFNPRRNLQYYQRSEPFIDEKTAKQVQLFFKVKTATDGLREQFIGEPDWLDSYTRILANAVDQTLRVEQKDYDYSKPQLDYLSELLYVRYRLRPEDLEELTSEKLREAILNKDEKLVRRSVFINYKQDLNKMSNNYAPSLHNNAAFDTRPTVVQQQDGLIEKLFGDIKASKENKEVERSVTITIKDKIVDAPIVKGSEVQTDSDENGVNNVKRG